MGRSLPALGEDDEKQYKMSVKSQNLRIKYTWVCIPSFFFFFHYLLCGLGQGINLSMFQFGFAHLFKEDGDNNADFARFYKD